METLVPYSCDRKATLNRIDNQVWELATQVLRDEQVAKENMRHISVNAAMIKAILKQQNIILQQVGYQASVILAI